MLRGDVVRPAGGRLLVHVPLTPKVRAAPKGGQAGPAVGEVVACEVTEVAPLYLDVKLAQGEHCLRTRQAVAACFLLGPVGALPVQQAASGSAGPQGAHAGPA